MWCLVTRCAGLSLYFQSSPAFVKCFLWECSGAAAMAQIVAHASCGNIQDLHELSAHVRSESTHKRRDSQFFSEVAVYNAVTCSLALSCCSSTDLAASPLGDAEAGSLGTRQKTRCSPRTRMQSRKPLLCNKLFEQAYTCSPVTMPVHCRLWKAEECKVWGVKKEEC